MAEEKITSSDLVDPSVLKELQAINKEMKDIVKTLTLFMGTARANNEELKKGATTQEEVSRRVKTTQENTQKLSDVEKEVQKIEQQHYQVLTKMVAERSEENKKLQEAIEQRKKENLERKASINSIEGLRAKNQLLRQERDKLIITDKNYAENLKRINDQINKNDKAITDASSTLEKQRFNIGNYKSAWSGVVSTFNKVIGVFAAVGISAKTFHKVIESSQALTDKYEAVMKGISTAIKSVFASIRDGDWSNLLDNMQKAYERGKKYQEVMDALSKSERANMLILKEKRQEFLTLREQAMDQSLTAKQNYDAATKALKLIKENYETQKIINEEKINAQAALLNLKTGENLSDNEKIENTKLIMKAYIERDKVSNKTREIAEEINNALDIQNAKLKLNSLIPLRTESVEKEKKSIEDEIKSLSGLTDEYRIYAAILRTVEYKKSGDAIKAYLDLIEKQAEADAAYQEENKRMIQTQSTAHKKMIDDKEKDDKKYEDNQKMQLESFRKIAEENIKRFDNLISELSKRRQEYNKLRVESEKETSDEINKNNADNIKEIDALYELDSMVIKSMYADKLLTTNEYEDAMYESSIQAINDKIAYAKNANLDASEYEKQLAEETTNYKIKQNEREKQNEEELGQYKREIYNQTFEFASALFDREVSNLETQKEYELSLAGDNAKAKEAIETRYASKIAAIKKRQAMAEKAQSLFNIGINTAQAIIKFLADPGGYPGLALSVAAGILGALQAATVAATPIPKFANGVIDFEGGQAIVGEEGREAVKLPSGKMFLTPDTATRMMLPSGTDVYTNAETEAMLRGGMQVEKFDQLISEQKATRKMLASKPSHNVKITDRGWKETTETANSVATHIDKYFRK